MKFDELEKKLKEADEADVIATAILYIRNDTQNILASYKAIHAMATRIMPFLVTDVVLTAILLALVIAQIIVPQ